MKSTKQLLDSLINIMAEVEVEEKFIGYNRLQYTVYLLQLTGLGDEFSFFYKQNELYSEELNSVLSVAKQLNYIKEDLNVAEWGGVYYTYKLLKETNLNNTDGLRQHFIQHLLKMDAEMLDLITSATYLHDEFNNENPWDEIRKTKWFYSTPQNAADEYFQRVKEEYRELKKFVEHAPSQLPDIA